MILAIPIFDRPEITDVCIDHLIETTSPHTQIVLVNNGPMEPNSREYPTYKILRNTENLGYYYPLLQIYEAFDDDIICLMHNDVFIYEKNWDLRVRECFENDPLLALIGFVGSNEVDELGGRGGGTMSNFAGKKGQQQISTGRLIKNLHSSLILDSLFMGFRASVIPILNIDRTVPLAHFMDRIWPMKLVEAGYHVGTLGIEVDHMGGVTILGADYEKSATQWCLDQGVRLVGGGDLSMYLEMESRWLSEFRDEKKLIPASIDASWNITRP